MAKVKTPAEVISSSDPEIVKVTLSSSASIAVTVPIAVWFSAALKLAAEVKTGALSFWLVILIVTSCEVELIPSLTLMVSV